ncbi:MAG: phage tail sheath family protein [Acidobacteriaceae bacterium]|nr:phage tail sheath family protein [Acidobacteriaceae bacterium]MBV9778561.1 phage tail sheath family protein [Acidobacteriaceae bacterium]
MPEYLSPGVYVEEVPSTIKPIVGVSTSTAAFVGVVPDQVQVAEDNPDFDPTINDQANPNSKRYRLWTFPFPDARLDAARTAFNNLAQEGVRPARPRDTSPQGLRNFRDAQEALAVASAHTAAGDMAPPGQPVLCTTFADFTRHFGGFSTDGLAAAAAPAPPPGPGARPAPAPAAGPGPVGETPPPGQNQLAHGVFGFFNNGGTRCYVMRYRDLVGLQDPLSLVPLEHIDEISIVAAPGIVDEVVQANIVDHCENMTDRFAVLDAPETPDDLTVDNIKVVGNTDYGALYFPWIKVFDTTSKLTGLKEDGEIYVAPSGHMAGIYARVDHERGVHKAPANEVVRGALTTETQISKNLQAGLNPDGVNCIRKINGNITVWGARTIGGDLNEDLKYINVRRLLIFLRKSIDQGTQWVVFEPNDRTLWAKIVRNVTAFLTTVWRDGALFGSTPAEAFYVKCDDETNPPEERDLGRVITEIGVAIVRPAEFVIFRIEQWAGPQAQ